MKWILALIVACNFHLVHKSRSSQIYHPGNMLSANHLQISPYQRTSLSTSCVLLSHSDVRRCLTGESVMPCGVMNLSYKSGNSGATWTKFKVSALARYVRSLRWTPIPLGIGFAYIAYQQFRHVKKREASKISEASSPTDLLASDFQISLYRMLPLRASSRFWGWVNTVDLPLFLREPLLRLFITTYRCNVSEAMVEDLRRYHNLGEFFRRSLKPEVRPIHPGNNLVSPCDGTILHYGTIENGLVEQVKGITYSLKAFLGSNLFCDQKHDKISDFQYQQQLLSNKENVLHHCVVYLAPGDYHKFHSPANWVVRNRRHFPGELFSVRPGFVNWISGLFSLNERVVYSGEWEHGFFSMTAVGATNVGSIKVYFDEALKTNKKKWTKGQCEELSFVSLNSSGIPVEKGSPFGEFNLGSTVVLIFEAPKDMKFSVQRGQRVKYGELVGWCHTDDRKTA